MPRTFSIKTSPNSDLIKTSIETYGNMTRKIDANTANTVVISVNEADGIITGMCKIAVDGQEYASAYVDELLAKYGVTITQPSKVFENPTTDEFKIECVDNGTTISAKITPLVYTFPEPVYREWETVPVSEFETLLNKMFDAMMSKHVGRLSVELDKVVNEISNGVVSIVTQMIKSLDNEKHGLPQINYTVSGFVDTDWKNTVKLTLQANIKYTGKKDEPVYAPITINLSAKYNYFSNEFESFFITGKTKYGITEQYDDSKQAGVAMDVGYIIRGLKEKYKKHIGSKI